MVSSRWFGKNILLLILITDLTKLAKEISSSVIVTQQNTVTKFEFDDGSNTMLVFGRLGGRTHVCTPDYVSVTVPQHSFPRLGIENES